MAQFPAATLNAAGNAALVAGTTYYLSGHTANPTTTGGSELSGGGYARQPIVFSTWASGATSNNAAIAIPNAGSTAVGWVGIWSAVTAGTYLGSLPMASSVTAASISFAIGAIAPTAAG